MFSYRIIVIVSILASKLILPKNLKLKTKRSFYKVVDYCIVIVHPPDTRPAFAPVFFVSLFAEGLLAKLDRASDLELEGRAFESPWDRHLQRKERKKNEHFDKVLSTLNNR